MIFVAVWPAGKMDLVILPSEFKITSASYVENCLKPLLEGLPSELDKKKVILYQDLAPVHRVKKTPGFVKENFPRFIPARIIPAELA